MGSAFEESHLKGVEENGRKDQSRERVQKGIKLLGLDDRVGLEGGGEDDQKKQDAEKPRGGEMIRNRDKDRERKNGEKENAQDAFQKRCWLLFERVQEDPSPAPP